MTVTINGNGTVADSTYTLGMNSAVGFKNRIINGDMRIDQRNAGASVVMTAGGVYPVDRWVATEDTDGAMTAQQSSTAPTGFTKSLVMTTTTADASLSASQYCLLAQRIEGFNVADLAWGTASAKSVTLSFQVRSSLTGTFGGALRNGAANRSYPFTYTISAADTWEQKTITVAGDTTGTWATDNTAGLDVLFGLGVGSAFSGTAGAWAGANYISATGATSVIGTLNATFYITGVQLEPGTQATAFERRAYGHELMLCQRYCQVFGSGAGAYENFGVGMTTSTTNSNVFFPLTQPMRIQPSLSTVGTFRVADFVNYSSAATLALNTDYSGKTAVTFACTSTGLTSQRFAFLQANNDTSSRVILSAEL